MNSKFGLNRFFLAGVTLLFSFATAVSAADQSKKELVFLNWADYLEPSLVDAFEAKCGCKLTQVYYETDDHRDELMLANEGGDYDVIVMNGLMIDTYRKRGWLGALSEARIPNLKHINPEWANAFSSAPGFAVPYFWGTMGLAYRADLVSVPITSWKQFYEPSAELSGKIRSIQSARDLLAGALKAVGGSINETDTDTLNKAEELLMKQKPHIEDYTYISLSEDSALVTGDTVAAIMFSGDALMVSEYNENITYVLPEEGGQIWVDHLVISSRSGNKELAAEFINFLNEPENAAKNAEYVYYATPNLAAEKLLPEEFLNNPIIYPSKEALVKSEFYATLPPRVEKKYGDIFSRVVK